MSDEAIKNKTTFVHRSVSIYRAVHSPTAHTPPNHRYHLRQTIGEGNNASIHIYDAINYSSFCTLTSSEQPRAEGSRANKASGGLGIGSRNRGGLQQRAQQAAMHGISKQRVVCLSLLSQGALQAPGRKQQAQLSYNLTGRSTENRTPSQCGECRHV